MLQLCANGARSAAEHPALPVTAAAVAADVAACLERGIVDVHTHPKDAAGRDSMAGEHIAAVVSAVRVIAPGMTVGVTSGAWIEAEPAARLALLDGWTELPDHVSVNWHEAGAADVARRLMRRGVSVHAGLFVGTGGPEAFLASGLAALVPRVLVEVPGDVPDPLTATDAVLARLAHLSVPLLLHGMDATAWPILRHAVALGLDTRIGLEDALVRPDGTPARDNAQLVADAARLGAAVYR